LLSGTAVTHAQLTASEQSRLVGDAPFDPGPLASLSGTLNREDVRAAIRKVGDWENARIAKTPDQDWTFATLYLGLLSASHTLNRPLYHHTALTAAKSFKWRLGKRQTHADDQAIGQVYLELYHDNPEPGRISALKNQFDRVKHLPDDPKTPIWWWCDALFMAPPVWVEMTQTTHDPTYLDYMDHEWHLTDNLLWDPNEKLFSRDESYLTRFEQNGRKMFWSRGNGWVMGGLVEVLTAMPAEDPRRQFYIERLQEMAASVAAAQGHDGLWRAGLLDPNDYPNPEVSGSAFFVYAMTWGMQNGVLDSGKYALVVSRAWEGLVHQIYSDGRLGNIQPVGEAPGAYTPSASYVFGVGAFLLAGSELDAWLASHPSFETHTSAK
jgi:Predicted unsaturated glucuronyl hydrolase involved in regulation of bacterial surface properties, and related proteins